MAESEHIWLFRVSERYTAEIAVRSQELRPSINAGLLGKGVYLFEKEASARDFGCYNDGGGRVILRVRVHVRRGKCKTITGDQTAAKIACVLSSCDKAGGCAAGHQLNFCPALKIDSTGAWGSEEFISWQEQGYDLAEYSHRPGIKDLYDALECQDCGCGPCNEDLVCGWKSPTQSPCPHGCTRNNLVNKCLSLVKKCGANNYPVYNGPDGCVPICFGGAGTSYWSYTNHDETGPRKEFCVANLDAIERIEFVDEDTGWATMGVVAREEALAEFRAPEYALVARARSALEKRDLEAAQEASQRFQELTGNTLCCSDLKEELKDGVCNLQRSLEGEAALAQVAAECLTEARAALAALEFDRA